MRTDGWLLSGGTGGLASRKPARPRTPITLATVNGLFLVGGILQEVDLLSEALVDIYPYSIQVVMALVRQYSARGYHSMSELFHALLQCNSFQWTACKLDAITSIPRVSSVT